MRKLQVRTHSRKYCNDCPEVPSRTGISRIWRNWDGYLRVDSWARVITLAMAAACDLVRLEIGPMSVDFLTLGGGWSMVCGTLDLVLHATGS